MALLTCKFLLSGSEAAATGGDLRNTFGFSMRMERLRIDQGCSSFLPSQNDISGLGWLSWAKSPIELTAIQGNLRASLFQRVVSGRDLLRFAFK